MIFVVSSAKAEPMKKSDSKSDAMLKTENALIMPSQELKWMDVPEVQGVKTAVVEGDPKIGPHHAFYRFKEGTVVPTHHHSADHFTTVISGTILLTDQGKEYRLGPGSFFSFLKKEKHSTKCDSGAECLLFIDSRGAWDVVPEKSTKAER